MLPPVSKVSPHAQTQPQRDAERMIGHWGGESVERYANLVRASCAITLPGRKDAGHVAGPCATSANCLERFCALHARMQCRKTPTVHAAPISGDDNRACSRKGAYCRTSAYCRKGACCRNCACGLGTEYSAGRRYVKWNHFLQCDVTRQG